MEVIYWIDEKKVDSIITTKTILFHEGIALIISLDRGILKIPVNKISQIKQS